MQEDGVQYIRKSDRERWERLIICIEQVMTNDENNEQLEDVTSLCIYEHYVMENYTKTYYSIPYSIWQSNT